MKRALLTLLAPPVAACRFGCATCCAAPISVFWITGIVGISYGLIGGPSNLMGPSWNTVALGLGLWAIAALWATVTVRSADDDCRADSKSTLCRRMLNPEDEPDPFEEVRKAR
jgi:hypothetical protein